MRPLICKKQRRQRFFQFKAEQGRGVLLYYGQLLFLLFFTEEMPELFSMQKVLKQAELKLLGEVLDNWKAPQKSFSVGPRYCFLDRRYSELYILI